ncbi:MAG: NADAR family protein [Gammaproteobacteria bacterium]|nr:NADAR family protein [Gammaproteobacteria bacterium]
MTVITKNLGQAHNRIREYDPASSVAFCKTGEEFGGLSNMAPGFPLCVNGVDIRTSEALYQACRFPYRPDVQQLIINERSPMAAKMRNKPYRQETRDDWNAVRVKIMRWCLRVKLSQNLDTFGDLLLRTGNHDIVEKKRATDFWGAKFTDDGLLVGENVLGRLLMELRDELKAVDSGRWQTVQPLNIPDFLLLQKPIAAVFSDARFDRQVDMLSTESIRV